MDKKTKLKVLKELENYVKKSQDLTSRLLKHGYNVESQIIKDIDNLCTNYIDNVKGIFSDDSGWIYWFIYDNDFGNRKFEAGKNGQMVPITTWKQILDLIERC